MKRQDATGAVKKTSLHLCTDLEIIYTVGVIRHTALQKIKHAKDKTNGAK